LTVSIIDSHGFVDDNVFFKAPRTPSRVTVTVSSRALVQRRRGARMAALELADEQLEPLERQGVIVERPRGHLLRQVGSGAVRRPATPAQSA
jgi:hypothetical protein